MKYFLSSFSIIFLFLIFPEFSAAQGLVTCTGLDCNFCTAVTMAHNIGKWLVGILILIATIMLAVTGVQMAASAGNSDAKQLLKERLQNIIIGFILILASVVIIDTLMKALVTDAQLRDYWNTPIGELCAMAEQPVAYVREGATAYDPVTAGEGVTLPEAVAEGTLTQEEAEALLAGSSIQVSSTDSCSDPNIKTCTSFSGIRPTTLNRVAELQNAIGEPITITGGTETGHTEGTISHGTGYKVDLRTDPTVNNYITTNYTSIGGNKYQDTYGNVYYRHGPVDHWDVTVVR